MCGSYRGLSSVLRPCIGEKLLASYDSSSKGDSTPMAFSGTSIDMHVCVCMHTCAHTHYTVMMLEQQTYKLLNLNRGVLDRAFLMATCESCVTSKDMDHT